MSAKTEDLCINQIVIMTVSNVLYKTPSLDHGGEEGGEDDHVENLQSGTLCTIISEPMFSRYAISIMCLTQHNAIGWLVLLAYNGIVDGIEQC